MDAFQKMAGAVEIPCTLEDEGKEEIRILFEDWKRITEENILDYLRETGTSNPVLIAEKLNISESTAIILIGRLARQGKLSIETIRLRASTD